MSFSRYYPTFDHDNYPVIAESNPSYNTVKQFQDISNYYVILQNYIEVGIKDNFLTFQRDLNAFKHKSNTVRTSSTPGQEQSSNQSQFPRSSTASYFPPLSYRNILLTHYYEEIPKTFNIGVFKNQYEFFMKNPQNTLATIRGFSFVNVNDNYFPIALTERPSKGSLKYLFSSNSTNDTNGQNIHQKPPITAEGKFDIIIELLNGMAFIHKEYVHSNLNPTTVYLNEKFEAVICDYFLFPNFTKDNDLYQIDKETASKIYENSVYVAPEILDGEKFNFKADIYSFGMIIYFILTSEDPKEKEEIHFPENFPKNWKEIIESCIKKNPSERPTIEKLLDKFSDKKDVLDFISSIEPGSQITKISSKTDLSLTRVNSIFVKDGKLHIFREMIPNVNELSDEVINIISMAESNDIKSIEKVAHFLYTGENNFYRDFEYAFQCYKFAADAGSYHSIQKVAEFYEKGEGTEIRMDFAVDYHMKAIYLFINKSLDEIKQIVDKSDTINAIEQKLNDIKTKFDYKTELQKELTTLNEDKDKNKKQIDEIKKKIIEQIKIDQIKRIIEEITNISKIDENTQIESNIREKFDQINKNSREILNLIDKINELNNKYGCLAITNITQSLPLPLKKFNPTEVIVKYDSIEIAKEAKNELANDNFFKRKCKVQQFYYKEVETHRYDSLAEKTSIPRFELKDFIKKDSLKGSYKIDEINKDEKLGEGAFAETYTVTTIGEDKKLVAKIYKKILPSDLINSFKREIIMASELKSHPAILKYVGFSEYSLKNYIDGKNMQVIQPTLFMEYIENGDLEKAITTNPDCLTDTVKLKIMIGVASALSKMHKNNIIHRDLKPSNILINSNYEPVICDLGSSRQLLKNPKGGGNTALVGTEIFMPPEMFNKNFHSLYGSSVDIYAFGIIMYQLISLVKTQDVYKFNMTDELKKYNYSYLIHLRKSKNIIPKVNVNKTIDSLIERSWNSVIDERPTAEEIYNELVEEIENSRILLLNQDTDELKNYIEKLNNAHL